MTYTEKIIDGETVTIRQYTPEEIAEVEKAQLEAEANILQIQSRKVLRESALSKLIDLGLTEEEIASL